MAIIDPFDNTQEKEVTVKNKPSAIIDPFDTEEPTPPAQSSSQQQVPEWATTGGRFGKYGPTLYGITGAAKEVSRFGAETAALVGGGIAGATIGGPVGAVAGAGLAYGGVKSAERVLEGEKATIPEALLTSGKDILTGAAMEAGGQIIGKGVKAITEKIVRPTTKEVSDEVVQNRIKLAKEKGIELTPAEATGSKGLALYESMLDKSPFSTSIVNAFREIKQLQPLIRLREKLIEGGGKPEQVEVLGQKIKDEVNKFLGQYKSMDEAQLNELKDNVLKKIGSTETFETLGKKAQDAIAEKSKVIQKQASELYNKVGEMIPEGTSIRPESMRSTAESLLASESKKPPSLQNTSVQKILRDLSGSSDEMMQQINQYPEKVRQQIIDKLKAEGKGEFDWKTIQGIRSELNSRIAQADAAMKTSQPGTKFQSSPEAGIYKQLRKALDKDIEEFAASQGGDIKESFDMANAFYKEGKLTYNSPVIRRIINSNPEKLVDAVFRPKGGFELDAIKQSIGKAKFDETVKPLVTKRLLGDGIFSPKELSAKLKTYGDEVLSKVFNPDEIKMVKDLATDGRIQMETNLTGHPFLKTLSNEKPEVVVDSIIGAYESALGSKNIFKNISLIRSVVPKETFASLQREMSDRIFKLNQISGQVQPERLSKTIQKYDKVLKLMYSPEQIKWLKEVSEVGKLMASAERMAANPSGTAQNVVTWGTWGAILNNPIRGAFSGIIAPKVMSKFYLSDKGRKYFIDGMKTPLNSGKSAELYTKIASVLTDNKLDDKGKK